VPFLDHPSHPAQKYEYMLYVHVADQNEDLLRLMEEEDGRVKVVVSTRLLENRKDMIKTPATSPGP